MWVPNSIVGLIVFAAICTLTKKAWLKYQAKKQLKHLDYNTNTEKEK